jgi:hypothetical protein
LVSKKGRRENKGKACLKGKVYDRVRFMIDSETIKRKNL